MPAWAILASKQILWQFVVPIVVKYMRAHGYLSAAEKLAADAVVAVQNMKSYQEFPSGTGDGKNKPF